VLLHERRSRLRDRAALGERARVGREAVAEIEEAEHRLDVLPAALAHRVSPSGKGRVQELIADELGPELRCSLRMRDASFDDTITLLLECHAHTVELVHDLWLDHSACLTRHPQHRARLVVGESDRQADRVARVGAGEHLERGPKILE